MNCIGIALIHPQTLDAPAIAPDQTGADANAPEETLPIVLASLDDDKAEDVLTVDLRNKSPLADYMVIASGRSARHVGSICDKLSERLKERTGVSPRSEGVANGDWALIDAGDVIVHVFRPEVREFYALEKMWAPDEAAKRPSAPAAAPQEDPGADALDEDA